MKRRLVCIVEGQGEVAAIPNLCARILHHLEVDAVVLLCDEDEDCAATWGPDASRVMGQRGVGAAIMAVHEYETWLLLNRPDEELRAAGVPVPVVGRGAKSALRKLVPDYSPTLHQLQETQRIRDIATLRTRSPSFDKLVRSIALLCR